MTNETYKDTKPAPTAPKRSLKAQTQGLLINPPERRPFSTISLMSRSKAACVWVVKSLRPSYSLSFHSSSNFQSFCASSAMLGIVRRTVLLYQEGDNSRISSGVMPASCMACRHARWSPLRDSKIAFDRALQNEPASAAKHWVPCHATFDKCSMSAKQENQHSTPLSRRIRCVPRCIYCRTTSHAYAVCTPISIAHSTLFKVRVMRNIACDGSSFTSDAWTTVSNMSSS